MLLPLVVFEGPRTALYPWSRPGAFAHAPEIAGKARYLTTPFVFARIAIVFAAWLLFARAFRRASLAQDRVAGAALRMHQRLDRLGAGFIVVFALTITLAAYDWLASLDPSWSSTMFAVYVFAGAFVQGIAAITLATVTLMRRPAPARRRRGASAARPRQDAVRVLDLLDVHLGLPVPADLVRQHPGGGRSTSSRARAAAGCRCSSPTSW